MIINLNKLMCVVVVIAATYVKASDVEIHTFNFEYGGFKYASLKLEDKDEFEALRTTHNNQLKAGVCVPEIGNVFDNQIARRNGGNAWHALTVRSVDSNEMVAALIIGRIATVDYKTGEHAEIQSFIQSLGITDENNQRIGNSGLATYCLMTDMKKMKDHLKEFHQNAFDHCSRLAAQEFPLPIENTQATHVVLLVRPDAPDTAQMLSVSYVKYSTDLPFYSSETYAWVKDIVPV